MIQGEVTEDQTKISGEIISFYQNLYIESESWRPVYNFANCPTISEQDKLYLQSNFEEQEVLQCLKWCAKDKAPGPDGLTMDFLGHNEA